MGFRQRGFLLLAFLCGGLALSACSGVPLREINDRSLPRKVLVASENTTFKNAVVEKVLAELGQDGVFIRVTDVDRLDTEATAEFHAIIILDSCWAWDLSRSVRRFLARTGEKGRVILVVTAANRNWRPKVEGVDAVTSASAIQEADRIAEGVVAKARKLFGR